ncbi:hypothetical protein CVT26_009326 [Gymnopilus dilepis]|uniref:Uncharacterized protein n=1 Tax=Gymnopilus dilepis TaxID=231916 RepID=A0A409YA45_9AGAR|nr:hypothetical protein CVT26_009326 [Gymnopilus dilepis]
MSQDATLPSNWALHTVSPGLWKRIFSFLYGYSEPYAWSWCTSTFYIMNASQVCSLWRDIILSTPELWTDIRVWVPYRPSEHRSQFINSKLLTLVLQNSRSLPLKMRLSHHTSMIKLDKNWYDLEVVKLFLQATVRATELVLYFNHAEEDVSQWIERDDIQSGRKLQKLSLTLPRKGVGELIQYISKLWVDAPDLRSLVLTHAFDTQITLDCICNFYTFDFPFHQLSSLEVTESVIYTDALLRILSLTPSLITATFEEVWGDKWDKLELKVCTLQFLTDLSLGGGRGPSPSLTRLLEFLVLPSLTTLTIIDDRQWSAESFEKFLVNSSPRIQHLRFDVSDSSEADKIQCLRMLPSRYIRTLDLQNKNPGRRNTPSMYLGGAFCSAMREWDSSNEGFALCPNLEKLTIDYTDLCDTTARIFSDMIEERWRRSPKGRNFRLEITRAPYDAKHDAKKLSEMIRLLILRKEGLNLTLDHSNWLAKLIV